MQESSTLYIKAFNSLRQFPSTFARSRDLMPGIDNIGALACLGRDQEQLDRIGPSRLVRDTLVYLPALALYFIVLPRFYGFSTLGQPLQLIALALVLHPGCVTDASIECIAQFAWLQIHP